MTRWLEDFAWHRPWAFTVLWSLLMFGVCVILYVVACLVLIGRVVF